jgi:hypothetical protein
MNDPKIFQSQELQEAMEKAGGNSYERLKGFIRVLSEWCEDPGKTELLLESANHIDAADIQALRTLIDGQVQNLDFKNKNQITEQILFMILGALKYHSQNDSHSKPWDLAGTSLDLLFSQQQRIKNVNFSIMGLSIAAGLLAIWYFYPQRHPGNIQPRFVENTVYLETASLPNPYVPSHLYSLREKMKSAVCQYPQAALLPQEQRNAYLTFIMTGQIAVVDLSNLQAALTQVHCEYMPPILKSSPSK